MLMKLFDQIYLIVLPMQQILQKHFFLFNFIIGLHLVWKVANMQKCNPLKKSIRYFFLMQQKKDASLHKSKKIIMSIIWKCLTWCFWIFKTCNFLLPLKKTQGIVFSMHYIFANLPPSALNDDKRKAFCNKKFKLVV